eukprot:m.180808 g.180808  ORF g.180808 m.180808 type:complete len:96 (-) comp16619_c0_seq15:12-299(-)
MVPTTECAVTGVPSLEGREGSMVSTILSDHAYNMPVLTHQTRYRLIREAIQLNKFHQANLLLECSASLVRARSHVFDGEFNKNSNTICLFFSPTF